MEMKIAILVLSSVISTTIIAYPETSSMVRLMVCISFGILVWRAISSKIKPRSIKQQIRDYTGQIILSIVFSFVIKKFIVLVNDFEFCLAGFVCGMVSYGFLNFYRWLISGGLLEWLKNKVKNKL